MKKILTAVLTITISMMALPTSAMQTIGTTQLNEYGFGDSTQVHSIFVKVAGELVSHSRSESGELHSYLLEDNDTFTEVELGLPEGAPIASTRFKGYVYLLINVVDESGVSDQLWYTSTDDFFGWKKVENVDGEHLIHANGKLLVHSYSVDEGHMAWITNDGEKWTLKKLKGWKDSDIVFPGPIDAISPESLTVRFKGYTYIPLQRNSKGSKFAYDVIVRSQDGIHWEVVADKQFGSVSSEQTIVAIKKWNNQLYVISKDEGSGLSNLYISTNGKKFEKESNQTFADTGELFLWKNRLLAAMQFENIPGHVYWKSRKNTAEIWNRVSMDINAVDGISDIIQYKGNVYIATWDHTSGTGVYTLNN